MLPLAHACCEFAKHPHVAASCGPFVHVHVQSAKNSPVGVLSSVEQRLLSSPSRLARRTSFAAQTHSPQHVSLDDCANGKSTSQTALKRSRGSRLLRRFVTKMSQDQSSNGPFWITHRVELATAFIIAVLGITLGLVLPEDQSIPYPYNRIITVGLRAAYISFPTCPCTWLQMSLTSK